jgi:Prokaryotic E2 family E
VGDEAELLPELDREFLEEKEIPFSTTDVGGQVHVVINEFDFPAAYAPRKADLLIILPAGYPNAHPDMFWTFPDVKLASGSWPKRSDQHHIYGERNWQRWSRHYRGAWRAGIDGLRSYLAVVRTEIAKGI